MRTGQSSISHPLLPSLTLPCPFRPSTLSLVALCDILSVNPSIGLSPADVTVRQQQFGKNVIVQNTDRLKWGRFVMHEMNEPMMRVLLVVGVLYAAWGSVRDAASIFVVIAVAIYVEVK